MSSKEILHDVMIEEEGIRIEENKRIKHLINNKECHVKLLSDTEVELNGKFSLSDLEKIVLSMRWMERLRREG